MLRVSNSRQGERARGLVAGGRLTAPLSDGVRVLSGSLSICYVLGHACVVRRGGGGVIGQG